MLIDVIATYTVAGLDIRHATHGFDMVACDSLSPLQVENLARFEARNRIADMHNVSRFAVMVHKIAYTTGGGQ